MLTMTPPRSDWTPSPVNRASRLWRAVLSHDARADGTFVYAVRSTGIYCRPSCPSRRPARRQVVFYHAAEAAEADGFRPCRRCRPREVRATHPYAAAVMRASRWMEKQILAGASLESDDSAGRLTLKSLGARMGVSPFQLQRAFRRMLGVTPRQYVDTLRMNLFRKRIQKGGSVTTALYDAGFTSSSRLYERAPAQLGMTPAAYRRGGAGMQIHYTVAASPLGRLLVAATGNGISAVYLGENEVRLAQELAREYPRAEIRRDASGLKDWVDAIVAHLRGQTPRLDLPTDVQATAFQRRVWEELQRIPYGETRTYAEVARAVGRPRAVRAVGRACATNPTSIVVPCHRVVRGDGNLAGYRWGVERKRALLEKESGVRSTSETSTSSCHARHLRC